MEISHIKQPLADRIRPTTFDEVAGQARLVGKNGIIRKLIENNRIPNMIFYPLPMTTKSRQSHSGKPGLLIWLEQALLGPGHSSSARTPLLLHQAFCIIASAVSIDLLSCLKPLLVS